MSDTPSRLRLPLKIRLGRESVGIHDAAGTLVCFVYFDEGCAVRRSVRQRLTKDEAIAIAKVIARALTRLSECSVPAT